MQQCRYILRNRNCLPFVMTCVTPVFWWVRVAHLFSFSVVCFVLFVCLFVCRRSVSNVADVSGFIHSWLPLWFSLGLSILDCPFCFLWRLYKTSSPLLHVVSYLTPDSRGNTILPIFHLNSFNFFSMFDFTCIVHEKNVLPYQSTWFHQYPRLSGDCVAQYLVFCVVFCW